MYSFRNTAISLFTAKIHMHIQIYNSFTLGYLLSYPSSSSSSCISSELSIPNPHFFVRKPKNGKTKKSSDLFTVSSQPNVPRVSLLALSPLTMTSCTLAMHKAASVPPAFFLLQDADVAFLQLVSKSELEMIHGNTQIFTKKTKD